jgi:hypothetical protein
MLTPAWPKGVGEQDQVAEVTGEAVEPPDQDVADVARLDHLEHTLQTRPFHVLARPTRVVHDGHRPQVVQLRIGPELLGLALDREPFRRLLLGRYPAVRHRQHPSPLLPRAPRPAGAIRS